MLKNYIIIFGLLLFFRMTLQKTSFPCTYYTTDGLQIGFNKPYNMLEVQAATRLQEQYVCSCQTKRQHFPQIVHVYRDWFGKRVVYTSCGFSLKHCKKKVIDIPDHEQQLQCIFNNFVRTKLIHLDILPKNICIKNNNTICVIDFDIVFFLDGTNPTLETDKQKKFITEHSHTKSHILTDIEYNYQHNRPQHVWNADFTREMKQMSIDYYTFVDICFIFVYKLYTIYTSIKKQTIC